MLAVTGTPAHGSRSICTRSRSAASTASSTLVCGVTRTNSSPPYRARRSVSRPPAPTLARDDRGRVDDERADRASGGLEIQGHPRDDRAVAERVLPRELQRALVGAMAGPVERRGDAPLQRWLALAHVGGKRLV